MLIYGFLLVVILEAIWLAILTYLVGVQRLAFREFLEDQREERVRQQRLKAGGPPSSR